MKSFRTVRYETGKDTGKAALSGEIISLTYMKGAAETGSGFLKKLMR